MATSPHIFIGSHFPGYWDFRKSLALGLVKLFQKSSYGHNELFWKRWLKCLMLICYPFLNYLAGVVFIASVWQWDDTSVPAVQNHTDVVLPYHMAHWEYFMSCWWSSFQAPASPSFSSSSQIPVSNYCSPNYITCFVFTLSLSFPLSAWILLCFFSSLTAAPNIASSTVVISMLFAFVSGH